MAGELGRQPARLGVAQHPPRLRRQHVGVVQAARSPPRLRSSASGSDDQRK